MRKSQLRRLAADYADGRIEPGEYRQRRREMIDTIVRGERPIQRETPITPRPPPPTLEPQAPAPGGAPWHLLFGGAAAVFVALLLWMLLTPEEPPPPPPPRPPTAATAPADVPRSRTLVESFLALRDFSAPAMARFRSEWNSLDDAARGDARQTSWFRSLVRALRDEVKTQKALAGLDGGEAARERARDVLALADFLQIADQLPGLDDISAPAAGVGAGVESIAASEPAAAGTGDEPAPVADAGAAPASAAGDSPVAPDASAATGTSLPAIAAAAAPAAAAPEPRAPTGREWLARQPDDALTLQIFAVNRLDSVERLMVANPDLPVHVIAADGASPRYRVFHGVYQDEGSARAGFDALPADVMAATGGAIVKSFAAVREDLLARTAGRRATPAPPGAPTPTPAPATSAVSGSAADYTLQLFASASLSNARALVNAFPDLSLELISLRGEPSPYRVLYGRFASMQDARNAAAVLPANLLARIGDPPLPKALPANGVRLP